MLLSAKTRTKGDALSTDKEPFLLFPKTIMIAIGGTPLPTRVPQNILACREHTPLSHNAGRASPLRRSLPVCQASSSDAQEPLLLRVARGEGLLICRILAICDVHKRCTGVPRHFVRLATLAEI
jgi:hypothetical protein